MAELDIAVLKDVAIDIVKGDDKDYGLLSKRRGTLLSTLRRDLQGFEVVSEVGLVVEHRADSGSGTA